MEYFKFGAICSRVSVCERRHSGAPSNLNYNRTLLFIWDPFFQYTQELVRKFNLHIVRLFDILKLKVFPPNLDHLRTPETSHDLFARSAIIQQKFTRSKKVTQIHTAHTPKTEDLTNELHFRDFSLRQSQALKLNERRLLNRLFAKQCQDEGGESGRINNNSRNSNGHTSKCLSLLPNLHHQTVLTRFFRTGSIILRLLTFRGSWRVGCWYAVPSAGDGSGAAAKEKESGRCEELEDETMGLRWWGVC